MNLEGTKANVLRILEFSIVISTSHIDHMVVSHGYPRIRKIASLPSIIRYKHISKTQERISHNMD